MGRQRNTQFQVHDRRTEILDTARSVTSQPQRFEWLRALLAGRGLATNEGILVELRSVPDQGCWVHCGLWLTASGTFLKFVADEPWGERALDGSGLLDDVEIEDVTAQISTAKRVPAIGQSLGWLALDVMREMGIR